MPGHDPDNAELIRRFFSWAYHNGLRPSIKAIEATDGHGPQWRISVMWGSRERAEVFADADAATTVREFTRSIEVFDPSIRPFDAGPVTA